MEQLLAGGAFVKVMPHDYKRVLAERAAEGEAVAGNGRAGGPDDAGAAPSLDGDADSLQPEQEPA